MNNNSVHFPETRFENLVIPAFEAKTNEIVELVVPCDPNPGYSAFIDALPEWAANIPDVPRNISCIRNAPIQLPRLFVSRFTIGRYLARSAVNDSQADEILESIGYDSDAPVASLDLTSQMLAQVYVSIAKQANVLFYSTAGLDPVGVRRVAETVCQEKNAMAGVAVVPSNLSGLRSRLSHYSSTFHATPLWPTSLSEAEDP